MSLRNGFLAILLVCSSSALFNTAVINAAETSQPAANKIHGKVTDIIEAAGYTYAEVDTGKEKVWAAASTTPLKIGDMIGFTTEMPMKNFHSNSMNRDFPIIYFVNGFITGPASVSGAAATVASPHESSKPVADAVKIEGINVVEGGNTIAELYADREKFKGKTIRVRGQVTKFTSNVMGRNWLHIRDSSTLDDLTLTTGSTAAIDAIVVIEGKLILDKDFGYGYVYPLIVEDASVTAE